nr:MAG TPA: hypothetical protein [Caudoviricetes sp.]
MGGSFYLIIILTSSVKYNSHTILERGTPNYMGACK